MKFSDKEKALAIKQVQSEWNTFQVPDVVHSHIKELFWEHLEREETVKILMMDFGMKECYARSAIIFPRQIKSPAKDMQKSGCTTTAAFVMNSVCQILSDKR